MVTFSCDACNDSIKKPKANQHAQRCRAPLTCIDCSKTFYSGEWSTHNSCISEAEAYQGHLYKPTKKELKRKAAEMRTEEPAKPQELSKNNGKVEAISATAKESKKPRKDMSKAYEADCAVLRKLGDCQPMTVRDAIRQLKSQNKLDKIGEKSLTKRLMDHIQVQITDGEIDLAMIKR